MHVGGGGHKHAQIATATLQLFIGLGWKHSGAWGIFNTRAYCFCRWSGAGRLGLWHLFWLGAIVPISHDQTYFNCGRVKRRGEDVVSGRVLPAGGGLMVTVVERAC